MRPRARSLRIAAQVALLCSAAVAQRAGAQPPGGLNPIVQADDLTRIAPHTWEIPDNGATFVPNVGIVVGARATLVIDTGLGERNGAIILEAARELSDNRRFYIAATHFHPEHDLGAGAFPDDALLVRWLEQQRESDELGIETMRRFSSFAPIVAELLDDVEYRTADILFPDRLTLDLGGVHVQVIGVGPNHTIGDTVFYVVEDRVLFAGDVVMPVFPSASAQYGDIERWIQNMHDFESLGPEIVVPAHGRLLDAASLGLFRDYLLAVRSSATTLASSGRTDAAAREAAAAEIAAQFPALLPPTGAPSGRILAALGMVLRAN